MLWRKMKYECIIESYTLVAGMGSVREGHTAEYPEDPGKASETDKQEDSKGKGLGGKGFAVF